jgi:O-antigen/teichoic acid export membrane protein
VIGYTLGSIVSGVASVSLLYSAIIRKLPIASVNKAKLLQTFRQLLQYGVPLSVGSIIVGITTQIYYFVLARSTDLTLIGNFRIATNFYVLLSFFTYPVQTVLFPAFSKLDPAKDKELLRTVFSSSVKYSSFFVAPAVLALMVLSGPMISSVYGNKWSLAPLFLTLYVIGDLFLLAGNIIYGQLLYATGDTKFLMKLNTLKLLLGVPSAFLLIPPLGVFGLILVIFIAGVPTILIGVYWTWKRYEAKADLRNSAKIFLASAIAGAASYLFQTAFAATAWITLILSAGLFLAVYLVIAPLVGAINQTDISNLRVMFSGLGPVSRLLKALLDLVEKPLGIKKSFLRSKEIE